MRRLLFGCVLSLLSSAAFPSLALFASAHARANKSSAPAGARIEIQFTVEHGCNGSPTTKLEVRLPPGVTKPVVTAKTGWVSSVNATANTVAWTGGTLSATKKSNFGIMMTLPNAKGTVLSFPMVQTCKKGTLRWVEGPKSSYPSPTVTLN
jgi:periplasmic copper chaperone A